MKKTILAIALALSAMPVLARDLSTGTIMVTGDTNLDIGSTELKSSGGTTTTDSTELNLTGVYFVARNFGVGLMLGAEETETDDGSVKTKQSMTMLGPIVGYNISLNSDASIMLHASVFVLTGETEVDTGFDADIDGEGYMLGGLYSYFLNQHVALNVGLRMVQADVDITYSGNTDQADMDETGASVGLAVFF